MGSANKPVCHLQPKQKVEVQKGVRTRMSTFLLSGRFAWALTIFLSVPRG